VLAGTAANHALAQDFLKKFIHSQLMHVPPVHAAAGYDSQGGGQVFGCPIGGTLSKESWAIDGSGSTFIWGFCDAHYRWVGGAKHMPATQGRPAYPSWWQGCQQVFIGGVGRGWLACQLAAPCTCTSAARDAIQSGNVHNRSDGRWRCLWPQGQLHP
jgi:hypothetical protein